MKRRVLSGALVLAFLPVVLGTSTQDSASDAELMAGITEVKAGDFKGGVITLDRVVQRLAAMPGAQEGLAPAYLYLGVAYVALGQTALGKAKLQQAFLRARSLGLRASDVALDPANMPPHVLAAFEEVKKEALARETSGRAVAPASPPPAEGAARPPTRPAAARPTPEPKKGGSKAALILLGGGGVTAAGIVVATRGEDPAPVSVPTPRPGSTAPPGPSGLVASGPGGTITFVGSSPPPGSTVSVGTSNIPLASTYSIVFESDQPRGDFKVGLLRSSGQRCMFRFPGSYAFVRNQPQTIRLDFFFSDGCATPFTTTAVELTLYDSTCSELWTRRLSVSYNFVR